MKSKAAIKLITKGVGIAGIAGIIIVAPNATVAFESLAKMFSKKTQKSYPDYLKRCGYFKAEKQNDAYVIRLTQKGISKFNNIELEDYSFNAKKTWNGKWQLLMFDIPESHRNIRRAIVYKLKELGMRQLQNSVYVHYIDTKELAALVRQTYPQVASLILSASVERIDGEDQLKRVFKL